MGLFSEKKKKLFWYLTIPFVNKVSLQEQPVFELAVIRDGPGRAGILGSTLHQKSKHSE